MRVWLVDDKGSPSQHVLEDLLRELEGRSGTGLRLLGVSSFQPDFPEAVAKLVPDLLDLLVISEPVWPEGVWTVNLLSLGLGMVVLCLPERMERFRGLAEEYPLILTPPECGLEGLWLALVSAQAARRRWCRLQDQVSSLHQRLSDRIVIERAKGILIQMHEITEEEAYKRLQQFSRRQRRKIRDIAQSVLDMKSLFAPDMNGALGDFRTDVAGNSNLADTEKSGPEIAKES
jgi:hypothetical protein